MHVRIRVLIPLVGALVIAGCSGEGDSPPTRSATTQSVETTASSPQVASTPTDVVTGLDAPWSIVFIGDAALVSERDTGNILEVVGDGTRVVGTVADVAPAGEGGLLGIAVHDSDLYVYFTGTDGDNRVVRYPLTGTAGQFALGEPADVVVGIPGGRTHNGGRIAFGPDGMLYVATGDAQNRSSAQDPESLSGKILRLTPEGPVPEDNPIPGSLVWSLGHRNVQGLAWSADGTMFSAEFGQDTWDELNVIRPGGNYGWPLVEGIGGPDDFIDPVQQWAPDDASPSGMTITGQTIYIANLKGERLRAIPVADPATGADLYVGEYGRLRDVATAPDGSLWFLTNNTDGRGTPQSGDDRIIRVTLD